MTVYTQAMIDALKVAMASGTLSLTYEGKQITYRSMPEMERAIAMMQREVNAAAGIRRSGQVRVDTSKGL